jgi:hypothetical protein
LRGDTGTVFADQSVREHEGGKEVAQVVTVVLER